MVHTAQMDEGWETARNPRRPSVLEVDSAGNLLLSDDQVASRACSVATCLASHRAHIIGSQWAQAPGHGDPTTPHNRAWPAIATRLPPRPPPSPSPSTSLSLCVACLACVACWSSAHATKMAPTAPRRAAPRRRRRRWSGRSSGWGARPPSSSSRWTPTTSRGTARSHARSRARWALPV
jgi:hypothetical protein